MKSLIASALTFLLIAHAPQSSSRGADLPSTVSTVATPIPLPGTAPMPPDKLRVVNPNTLQLTGTWRFIATRGEIATNGQFTAGTGWQKIPGAADPATVADFFSPKFDDAKWSDLNVPSNWEMEGFSPPTYNDADPTVGLYRRTIDVPQSFAGKRILWRFDGALSGTEVFVNGTSAGYHEGGYCAFDVDVTDLIQPGQKNLLTLRISKKVPTTDFDTGDYECLGGVYRQTYLIALPKTHVSDLTVQTPLDKDYRSAQLKIDVQVEGAPGATVQLQGRLTSADGTEVPGVTLAGQGAIAADGHATVSIQSAVSSPKLWSAEKPNLYFVVLHLTASDNTAEDVEQRFGFRQVEFKGGVLLWNGQPIKLQGTCRHEHYVTLGAALTDEIWLKDIDLMKRANVNAVRTSHYNHATRFLDLCDEKGFYILDEVPACWIHEFINNAAGGPAMKQRTAETIARDKNRPCVLAWSLGNENGMGRNLQTAFDYARQLDPTRPAFVSQQNGGSVKGQIIYDFHYPRPAEMQSATTFQPPQPIVYTEEPHIFYLPDYTANDTAVSELWGHALGDDWSLIRREPNFMGAFIWEWQGQGIADKYRKIDQPDPTKLRFENNKGVVDSYHNPKPEWWYVRAVYSPVAIPARDVHPADGKCDVPVESYFSFTDLSELTCHWTALKQDQKLQDGDLHIDCPPGQQTTATFPAPAGMDALRLEFTHPDGTSVTSYQLKVAGTPSPAPPPAQAPGSPIQITQSPDAIKVSNDRGTFVFDRATGELRQWSSSGHDLLVGGPIPNFGEVFFLPDGPWYRELQHDKLMSWTDSPRIEAANLTASMRWGTAQVVSTSIIHGGQTDRALGSFQVIYDIDPTGQAAVHWSINWNFDQPCQATEIGVKFTLANDLTQMSWSSEAYLTDYPPDHVGQPQGTCTSSDPTFRGAKRDLHWMVLSAKDHPGLTLLSDGSTLTARGKVADKSIALIMSRVLGIPHTYSNADAPHRVYLAPDSHYAGSFILRPQ